MQECAVDRFAAGDSGDQRVIVLGGGFFGMRAVEALQKNPRVQDILMVDHDAAVAQSARRQGIAAECMDGIAYLVQQVPRGAAAWIVPAIPVHVAFEWLAARRRLTPAAVPEAVVRQLPHAMVGKEGQAYASNATFVCPDDCDEPAERCRVTGKPRPVVMYRHLAALGTPFVASIVLRSRQLAPGVGGYTAAALFESLDRACGRPGPFLLSTACRCHGVIHYVEGIDGCGE